ncbi:hypothetical protein C8J47_2013 [Sphingomonas sp. PP-F2F-G114-C0414]|uniref:hypothetical protein n=1 Tax=Sphingomonas sp. PP-F2F-G114-C0414 TaxID=2135662 RepID=UPI000F194868|nr:hypothetical protein [Sphingomonas sp. PP-F2F-G114-C0414]RMB34292.1 hypothetical protein C8J47_2013 [Sphingomonas sp. PP-F2F-G114-C0414]
MDLIALLNDAVAKIPSGDHSQGLNAIVRHVNNAIRHIERDQNLDPDSCTDAIYRTNQAYEGSLKEAYRVLAGKDPSGLSPFQIEGYLESNNTVRPRVLTQLTRYRKDYRNPSAHDYKLDFDNDEALLAIVSVCGFAILLLNQIRSKIESTAAQARVAVNTLVNNNTSTLSNAEKVAAICLAYTRESTNVDWYEYERGIAESLVAYGYNADVQFDENNDDLNENTLWDVIVRDNDYVIGIDSRLSRRYRTDLKPMTMVGYDTTLSHDNFNAAVITVRSSKDTDYRLYHAAKAPYPLYIICDPADTDQLTLSEESLGTLTDVSSLAEQLGVSHTTK